VRLVQANIRSNLSVRRFARDAREVVATRPDVITYNEVPERADRRLAPSGYALYRSHRNRYTKATPVAWRTSRWRKVDHGTYRFSNYRRKPDGRRVRLGLRFANWVTLEARNGRKLSVVSAHVAPPDDDMPDLLRRSVRRIGGLVADLAPRGPVLVGGDFNVHYPGDRYPRNLLEAARMRPTYDTLGSYFPTGDHYGSTIDYVFNRGKAKLRAERHRRIELHSDHDAVVADLGWRVDAPR
jgi:endonuclease/exonuclease/phosphatase family metal-dependent hydrolase